MEYRRLDWQELPLKKVISVIGDHRGRTPPKLATGKYRVFSAKNIKTGRIVAEDTIGYFDDELYAKYVRLELKRGDIIITSEAPFGEIFYWDSDEKAALSQRLFSVRIKDEFCAKFIYYYMTYEEFQSELARRSCGTTVLGLRQPELLKCLIRFPPLPTQRKIAKVLSAYDDLIENNTKQIRILERMAEELYKEWFVRFRFPGHEKAKFVNGLPEGWRVERLNKLLDVRYGKDHKNISDGDIPVFGSGGVMRYGARAQYDGESVLIPRKGSLNNIMYFNGPFWTVDTMFYSIPLVKHIAKYMYFTLAGYDMESFNTGAALPSMTTEILSHFKIVVPAEAILQRFDQHLSSLFSEKDLLQRQNALLARQRDLLLPRLMSGKLSVEGVG